MKKYTIILFLIAFLHISFAEAKIYECTYTTKSGSTAISSFNPVNKNTDNYWELFKAWKAGRCRELIVKKYFIDGSSCNIQLYKSTKKVANLTCAGRKESAMQKLRAIAKRDFNY